MSCMSWTNNLVGRSGGEIEYSWVNYNDIKTTLTPSQIAMLGDRVVFMKPPKEIKRIDCECGISVKANYFGKHVLTKRHLNAVSKVPKSRVCKSCCILKNLEENYATTNKKNNVRKTYRYICNPCRTKKNREYMKKYQKNKTKKT